MAKPCDSSATANPPSRSRPATEASNKVASGAGSIRLASSLPDRLAATSAAKTRLAAEGFMPRSVEAQGAHRRQGQPHRRMPSVTVMDLLDMGGKPDHQADPRDVDRHRRRERREAPAGGAPPERDSEPLIDRGPEDQSE